MWMKMANNKSFLIISGITLIALAFGVGWAGYLRLHSPLDSVVPAHAQRMDGPFTQSSSSSRPSASTGEVRSDPILGDPPGTSNGNAAANTSSPVFFQGYIPGRLIIPSIGVDAPVVPTTYAQITYSGRTYLQWQVPYGSVVGWQDTSSMIGVPGNTVFNGHNNSYGEVFKNLGGISIGDQIQIQSGSKVFHYQVREKMILPERFEDLSVRLQNARWIMTTDDERITLVTCWPADDSTHRLIVVAFPVQTQDTSQSMDGRISSRIDR